MGVKGAALATIISEFICFIWSINVLIRALKRSDIVGKAKYNFEQQKRIIAESIPAILQRSIIAIGVSFRGKLYCLCMAGRMDCWVSDRLR